jgi:transcriptional regulator with XRE-family HTH domain
MGMSDSFGSYLAFLIKRKGMTYRSFAEAVSSNHSLISKMVAGKINPPKYTKDMEEWCKVLGVPHGSTEWVALMEAYHLARVPDVIQKEYKRQKSQIEKLEQIAKSHDEAINRLEKTLKEKSLELENAYILIDKLRIGRAVRISSNEAILLTEGSINSKERKIIDRLSVNEITDKIQVSRTDNTITVDD